MPIVLKSGSLNLLEPSGPVQVFNGIALPLPLTLPFTSYIQYFTFTLRKINTCNDDNRKSHEQYNSQPKARCTNTGSQVVRATNICGSSVWYLLRVNHLTSRKLGQLLDLCGPGSSVGTATGNGAGRSGNRIPVEARFSAPVQTGPGAHPASCTMGTGFFPGGKERPGRDADPSPLLVPLVMKE